VAAVGLAAREKITATAKNKFDGNGGLLALRRGLVELLQNPHPPRILIRKNDGVWETPAAAARYSMASRNL
jgi:hypothetical protein